MVTLALVALNVAVFAVELSQGSDIDAFVRRWGLVPADIPEGPSAAITLLTSSFLHAGWFHLLANLVYSATPSDVETVLVQGRPVVWQGKLTTADEKELTQAHQQVTEALLERRKAFVPE